MRFAEKEDISDHMGLVSEPKGPDKIIADTGTGVHLVGMKHVRPKDRGKVFTDDDAIQLSTANGKVSVHQKIRLFNDKLGENFDAVVLDKTPAALSVGRLCMDGDWELVWRNKTFPYLKKPGKRVIRLPVHNYVPYIATNNKFSALMAGTDVESSSSSDLSEDDGSPSKKEEEAAKLFGDDDEDEVDAESMEVNVSKHNIEEPIPKGVEGRLNLENQSLSVSHLMTHLPKNPHCAACQRAKREFKPARRKPPDKVPEEKKKFGRLVTMDHLICRGDSDKGIDQETVGLIVNDHDTKWIACYPSTSNTVEEVESSLRHYMGSFKIKLLYSDNAPELISAARNLKISHDTSTPYRSQTNSKAERMIRKVLEGTRTVIEQSGLSSKWWPMACQHFCFSLNISVVDGDSSYNKKFGHGHFKGLRIPFGSLIDFKIPKTPSIKIDKFGKPTAPGLFLGYYLAHGGQWKGDYLVTPITEFTEDNKSGRVIVYRVKEVIVDKSSPVAFPMKEVTDKRLRNIEKKELTIAFNFDGRHHIMDCIAEEPGSTKLVSSEQHKLSERKPSDEYELEDGRIRKRHRNSSRPLGIPKEVWRKMSYKDRKDVAVLDAELAAKDDTKVLAAEIKSKSVTSVSSSKHTKEPHPSLDNINNWMKGSIKRPKHLYDKRAIVEFCCGENSKMG